MIRISILSLLFLFCATTQVKLSVEEQDILNFEGWSFSPEERKDPSKIKSVSKKEYFYMSVQAFASQKAIKSGMESYMQKTCEEYARLQNSDQLLKKMIDDSTENCACTGRCDGVCNNLEIFKQLGIMRKNCILTQCNASGPFVKIPENQIRSWQECKCNMYIFYPGGAEKINDLDFKINREYYR